MNETVNLHLPQFEATDRIHHDDFNDAFSKIDAAVKANTNSIANAESHIICSYYQGNGTGTSVRIETGKRPKLVVLIGDGGNGDVARGLLSVENGDIVWKESENLTNSGYVSFDETGFTLMHGALNTSVGFNRSGETFRYWALC